MSAANSVNVQLTLADVEASLDNVEYPSDPSGYHKNEAKKKVMKVCEAYFTKTFEEYNSHFCNACDILDHGTLQAILFLVHTCGFTIFLTDVNLLTRTVYSKDLITMKYILSNIPPNKAEYYHINAWRGLSNILDWKEIPEFIKVYIGTISSESWKAMFHEVITSGNGYFGSYWFEKLVRFYQIVEPNIPLLREPDFVKELQNLAQKHNPKIWKYFQYWKPTMPADLLYWGIDISENPPQIPPRILTF